MKKGNIIRILVDTGFVFSPVVFVVAMYLTKGIPPNSPLNGEELLGLICISVLPVLLIALDGSNNLKEKNAENGRELAKRPKVPQDMLYKQTRRLLFWYVPREVCM